MRIIGGEYGGQTFTMPTGLPTRPTTDRAKEALFNWLEIHFHLNALSVLDAYAGSGSVSVEFLSRGVDSLISIDKNPKVIKHLYSIKNKFDSRPWTIKQNDVLRFIKNRQDRFDLIFADPPYDDQSIPELIEQITKTNILKSKGIFILEHFSKLRFTSNLLIEQRTYGQSTFSIYSK